MVEKFNLSSEYPGGRRFSHLSDEEKEKYIGEQQKEANLMSKKIESKEAKDHNEAKEIIAREKLDNAIKDLILMWEGKIEHNVYYRKENLIYDINYFLRDLPIEDGMKRLTNLIDVYYNQIGVADKKKELGSSSRDKKYELCYRADVTEILREYMEDEDIEKKLFTDEGFNLIIDSGIVQKMKYRKGFDTQSVPGDRHLNKEFISLETYLLDRSKDISPETLRKFFDSSFDNIDFESFPGKKKDLFLFKCYDKKEQEEMAARAAN